MTILSILHAIQNYWVDFLTLLFLCFSIITGIQKGLLIGMLDVGGFIFSFLSALLLYARVGRLLTQFVTLPVGISHAIGFFLAGFFMEAILSVTTRMIVYNISKIVKTQSKKSWAFFARIDTWLSFIPSTIEAILFLSFLFTLLVSLPIQGKIKKDIVSSSIGGSLVSHTQSVERIMNRIFGDAVSEALTFLTINPNLNTAERVSLGFTQSEGTVDEEAEHTMLRLVNAERTKQGLVTLVLSVRLRSLARQYAQDMFMRGYFSHYSPEGYSPFDRMKKENISFMSAGENLALAPNVDLAHQGLMNSPGHRANILSPEFRQVGIGVIDGGIYGQMFVQEFTD